MSNALQSWPIHQNKPQELDELLTEFASLNRIRNHYMHGLWYTHAETQRVFLVEEPDDYDAFHKRREVKVTEIKHTLSRITAFIRRTQSRQGIAVKEPIKAARTKAEETAPGHIAPMRG